MIERLKNLYTDIATRLAPDCVSTPLKALSSLTGTPATLFDPSSKGTAWPRDRMPKGLARSLALLLFLSAKNRVGTADLDAIEEIQAWILAQSAGKGPRTGLEPVLRTAVAVASGSIELHVPVPLRKGSQKFDELRSIEEGRQLFDYLCTATGLDTLAGESILDVGCGVKLTQAILGYGLAVGHYHGVDIDAEMIEFLRTKVTDDRFSFHHINVRNAMYRPQGDALSASIGIGPTERRFDLVIALSLFTHLAPDDYAEMLLLCRRHVRERAGRFLFSTFIDDTLDAPHSDFDPERPLFKALYREDAVRSMVESAGWKIIDFRTPRAHMEHHFVCAPKS